MPEESIEEAAAPYVPPVKVGPEEKRPPRPLPPAYRAVLERKVAPNGLAYRPMTCRACGLHLGDEAILLGVFRKKCPECKFPNEIEINRIGGVEELRELATKQTQEATPTALYAEAQREGVAPK